MVRRGGVNNSVVGEEEDDVGSADSAEEEKKQRKHELEVTKTGSKGEDGAAEAHPSDWRGSTTTVVPETKVLKIGSRRHLGARRRPCVVILAKSAS